MGSPPLTHLSARADELALVERCCAVARGVTLDARDMREANVFRVAAMIVGPGQRAEAARLRRASEEYFAAMPGELLASAEVVRQGWVSSLPRLRELLDASLHG